MINTKEIYNNENLTREEKIKAFEEILHKRQTGRLRCRFCGKKLKRISNKVLYNYEYTGAGLGADYTLTDIHIKCLEEEKEVLK